MQRESLASARAVAERAADLLAEALRAKPETTVLLPAGRTPVLLYAEVVRRARARALDLSRARLFQLDELLGVPPADARSFQAFLRRHLVEPLALARGFHGLDGGAQDPAREIERHRRSLAALGGADLALLGLGRNGHVAFNEPGSGRVDGARVVALAASTVAALGAEFGAVRPERGLTLGLAEIAAARTLVMLVTGDGKAEALARLVGAPPSQAHPASLLAGHPRFHLLTDLEASGSRA